MINKLNYYHYYYNKIEHLPESDSNKLL